MIQTGVDGYLKSGGVRIGKCRSIRLNIAKKTLPTTTLRDFDETFIAFLRNTAGSASLFYDPDDTAAVDLLNTILGDSIEASTVIELVLSRPRQKAIVANVILTEIGISVAYGEAQVCEITFQCSGKSEGGF
jgi:hypothetical protein